jgi:hypothetical protein
MEMMRFRSTFLEGYISAFNERYVENIVIRDGSIYPAWPRAEQTLHLGISAVAFK